VRRCVASNHPRDRFTRYQPGDDRHNPFLTMNDVHPQVLRERLYRPGSSVYRTVPKLLSAVGHHEWQPKQPGQRGLRILSLDGGGTRGVLTIVLLAKIIEEMGIEVHDLFDIICGTSTGGILACLFAIKRTTIKDAAWLYDDLIKKIFNKAPAPLAYSNLVLRTAQYNEHVWEQILIDLVGDTLMIDSVSGRASEPFGRLAGREEEQECHLGPRFLTAIHRPPRWPSCIPMDSRADDPLDKPSQPPMTSWVTAPPGRWVGRRGCSRPRCSCSRRSCPAARASSTCGATTTIGPATAAAMRATSASVSDRPCGPPPPRRRTFIHW
jgi:hypothetical protein